MKQLLIPACLLVIFPFLSFTNTAIRSYNPEKDSHPQEIYYFYRITLKGLSDTSSYPSLKANAKLIKYDQRTHILRLYKNAILILNVDSLEIKADYIEYHDEDKVGMARGHVTVFSSKYKSMSKSSMMSFYNK